MPSIVGRKTKSLTASGRWSGSSADFGYGGTGPQSRNYPSSAAYQEALRNYGSLSEDIRARVNPDTGRPRSFTGVSDIPSGGAAGPRPFDIPSDNLPVPGGRIAGRLFSMLAFAATTNPYLRAAALVAELALSFPPESYDRTQNGPAPAYLWQTMPGALDLVNGKGWHTRKYCPNCVQTAGAVHHWEHRNVNVACYNHQYWSCVPDPPGRVMGPGSVTTDCWIWGVWAGAFCNGCNDYVWVRDQTCDGSPRRWPGKFQYMHLQQQQNLLQGLQNEMPPLTGLETAAPRPWPVDMVPHRANDEHHQVGPRTRVRSRVRPKPWQEPARRTSVSVSGGGSKRPRAGRPVVTRDPHLRRPPGRNERERKYKVGGPLAQVLMRGIGHLTEGLDLVNAIYWALPWYMREPGDTQIERIEAVLWFFANAEEHEWDAVGPAVLAAIIVMELQDHLIGWSARKRGEVYAEVGRQMGLPDATSWGGRIASEVDKLLAKVH